MKRYLLAGLSILSLLGCREEKVSPVAIQCYPALKGLTRDQYVQDVPVTVRLTGGLAIGNQLVASNGVAWGGCNLPEQFKEDSLAIYVSGYLLTSHALETMNLTPLPFEVTSVKLR